MTKVVRQGRIRPINITLTLEVVATAMSAPCKRRQTRWTNVSYQEEHSRTATSGMFGDRSHAFINCVTAAPDPCTGINDAWRSLAKMGALLFQM